VAWWSWSSRRRGEVRPGVVIVAGCRHGGLDVASVDVDVVDMAVVGSTWACRRGRVGTSSYHFNHYTQAVACRPLCIMPQVGMIGYHYIYQLEIIIIIIRC